MMNINNWIIILLVIFGISTIVFFFHFIDNKKQVVYQSKVNTKMIKLDNHTWGYEIYVNGELYIRQTVIPCIENQVGFDNEIDAQKVATLVVQKIHAGQAPLITKDELRGLMIIE